MKPEELAAYIGAAAWLPQIASWAYRKYVRPDVRLVPDRYAEAGYTSYGPIFNLRFAFSVDNKHIVIDGIELQLRHEGGEIRKLRWAGLAETLSQITDAAGKTQVVSRDQTPIAIKVGTESLLEKFVRFQEPQFQQSERPLIQALLSHFNYLKTTRPDTFVDDILKSKEFFDLVESRKKALWWKAGRYEVTVELSSPQPFNLLTPHFTFELTQHDVAQLAANVEKTEANLRNIISSNKPDFQSKPENWNWANVVVRP